MPFFQLYFSRRQDIGVEEYMAVSKLSEIVVSVHNEKLDAMAAYIALRKDDEHHMDVHMDDFLEVTRCLDSVEDSQVVVARGSSKLVHLINTLLHQVKGDSFYFYFASEFVEESDNKLEARFMFVFTNCRMLDRIWVVGASLSSSLSIGFDWS